MSQQSSRRELFDVLAMRELEDCRLAPTHEPDLNGYRGASEFHNSDADKPVCPYLLHHRADESRMRLSLFPGRPIYLFISLSRFS